MLLRKYSNEYQPMIAWGQICLVVGLLFSMLGAGRFPTEWLGALLGSQSTLDFVLGFLTGLSAVLMGLSIVLNVRGLMLYRAERRQTTGRPASKQ